MTKSFHGKTKKCFIHTSSLKCHRYAHTVLYFEKSKNKSNKMKYNIPTQYLHHVPLQGMSKARMIDVRKQNCNPMTMKVTYYKKPVFIHQGYMQYLWDVDGTRYLDLFAGVATVSVGHCHP